PSMLDKQTNLKANFPNFINVLNTIQGGLPDVHIGVVTSDLGTSGADGMNAPAIPGSVGGCSSTGKGGALQTYGTTLVTGKYISDAPPTTMGGMRMTNYTGTLSDAFKAIASAGAAGCGFEQHIEAAKRALQPSNTANAGFLRSDAFLAVIIIADEDDCSMNHSTLLTSDTSQLGPLQSFRCTRYGITCDTGGSTSDAMNQIGPKSLCHSNESGQYLTKIADYVTFFKGLKPDDSSKVIMAAISGVTTPVETELRAPNGSSTAIPALAHSCTYTDPSNSPEVADPAIRIHELLDGFPNRSTFSTICQQDLSGGLVLIAQLLKTALGSPCIDGTLADVDPNTPGPQYDCSVSDVQNYGKANQQETILPECNNLTTPASSTNEPCWAIETDPMCSAGQHLTLKIERGSTAAPPDGTHTISYCVTQAGGGSGG
ncbi:MAG TPA: hypothetical protein VFQ65_09605, partial [Kofleriaceae bacterium]|nr:hypothetical protein [Kofleriaceae bacterium]